MVVLYLSLIALAFGAQHAVLAAGSRFFWNYRHQADICHAYHTLLSHGVPAQNIILMSFDDVPESSSNPFPGTLYNRPGSAPQNYNQGCIKDYTGMDVTSENFINIITGNSTAMLGVGTQKVLQSGPEDTVFINIVDHGSTGLISFPYSYLYASDLIEAFDKMTKNGMYKKMLVYVQACESGSMFEGLLDPSWKINVVTASNPIENSWGTYCPPDDLVNGVHLQTCLGDQFSVNWMQNTDSSNLLVETLQEQFKITANLTLLSHVSMYGSTSFQSDTLSVFFGGLNVSSNLSPMKSNNWESRDSKVSYFFNEYLLDPSAMNNNKLMTEILERDKIKNQFDQFKKIISTVDWRERKGSPIDAKCIKRSIQDYISYCGDLTQYALKYVSIIADACHNQVPDSSIKQAFAQICPYTQNN